MTIAGGDEVIVGTALQAPDYPGTIAYRLSDGAHQMWASDAYGWHTSARNTKQRELGVLVSVFPSVIRPTNANQGLLVTPTSKTIAIPNLRHSGNDISGDYWAQPQACISPNGEYVIWTERKSASQILANVRRINDGTPP